MTSFPSELQRIVDALRNEQLCAVIIDSTGSAPRVDLLFGRSTSFNNVHPTVLDTLVARGLLPPRVVETLAARSILDGDRPD
jgi:hypothetical protein